MDFLYLGLMIGCTVLSVALTYAFERLRRRG